MKVAVIDNGIQAETNKCITWQFDNATKLIGVINMLKDWFEQSTKNLWDNWIDDVVDIDSANEFGLSMWGKLLDCRRPVLSYGSPATDHVLSTTLYRKILKARFKLLGGNASVDDYCEYVYAIFGGKIKVTDGLNMALTFSVSSGSTLTEEESALISQADDVAFIYPAGVKNNNLGTGNVFGLSGQAPVTQSDPQIGGLGNSTFKWR